MPAQLGFNYIRMVYGQHETRRWYASNVSRGVAIPLDGIKALNARVEEWARDNASPVELAKVLVAFDPLLSAFAKALGPETTTTRYFDYWPVPDAELHAVATRFINETVPHWAELEGVTDTVDRPLYLIRHQFGVQLAQQQLQDWLVQPLPAARGASVFCNDPVDFQIHVQLEQDKEVVARSMDLDSFVNWQMRFMASKAKYLPAAWSFIGRLFGWNSSNGACERTQSVASINLPAFRRGRLGTRTLAGLVAVAESGDGIMPHIATWLTDTLPIRSTPAPTQDQWVMAKSAKRDLMAPVYLEDGADIETPEITDAVEGAARVTSSVLGIQYEDAIRLELACLSCDEDDMRLLYACPRSVAQEFAAQVLSVEGNDHSLRAWIATTLAQRLAAIHREYDGRADKSQLLFDVVQDWTVGGTFILSHPGPVERSLYFTSPMSDDGEVIDPATALRTRLLDVAKLIEAAANCPSQGGDLVHDIADGVHVES
jgi:hypothetical protein